MYFKYIYHISTNLEILINILPGETLHSTDSPLSKSSSPEVLYKKVVLKDFTGLQLY